MQQRFASLSQLMQRYGCSRATLVRLLKANGLKQTGFARYPIDAVDALIGATQDVLVVVSGAQATKLREIAKARHARPADVVRRWVDVRYRREVDAARKENTSR